MAITAQEVNKLRQMTGAGMMDCKKALTEADGDFDKAVELLRKKGQKVSVYLTEMCKIRFIQSQLCGIQVIREYRF